MAIGGIWRFALLVAVFPALLAAFGCAGGDGSGGNSSPAVQLAQLINEERNRRGVQYLTWDDAIAAVEQAHAEWLSQQPPAPYTLSYREDGQDGKLFPARLDDASVAYSTAQEWGLSTTTETNAGLVFNQLPDWIYEAQWDRFGIGYVKPPYREPGNQYWVVGLVED